jgi:hypothetical protein
VVAATRARTADRAGVPWISDGWPAYAEAIWDRYTDRVAATAGRPDWHVLKLAPGVAHTQGVKHRRGRRLARVELRAAPSTSSGSTGCCATAWLA